MTCLALVVAQKQTCQFRGVRALLKPQPSASQLRPAVQQLARLHAQIAALEITQTGLSNSHLAFRRFFKRITT
jgi:hypothetical protein